MAMACLLLREIQKPQMELYDLDKDPSESSNLASKYPEVVQGLMKLAREVHVPSKEVSTAIFG